VSGVKTRIGALGVDGRAVDCPTTLGAEVDSLIQWAHNAGKSTGIVTTTRITVKYFRLRF
jgi:alkaline phosphatase